MQAAFTGFANFPTFFRKKEKGKQTMCFPLTESYCLCISYHLPCYSFIRLEINSNSLKQYIKLDGAKNNYTFFCENICRFDVYLACLQVLPLPRTTLICLLSSTVRTWNLGEMCSPNVAYIHQADIDFDLLHILSSTT
jgi:hypothetical protein